MKRVAIGLAAGLLFAVSGDAQNVTPVMTPVLVDDTGKTIGPLVSLRDTWSNAGIVSLEVEGEVVFLRVERLAAGVRWNSYLFFTGLNCTGTALILAPSLTNRAAGVGADGTLYISDGILSDPSLTVGSVLQNNTCQNGGGASPLIALRPTAINLYTTFPPPYRVESYIPRGRVVSC